MQLEQPWARVKQPAVIPTPLRTEALRELDSERFAMLVRDHLVPRGTSTLERTAWEALWRELSRSDALAERTYDVLEQFLDSIEQALAAGGVDQTAGKRMRKFERFCGDAWQRLRVDHDRPLGWAGRAGAGFNPAGRKVIEQLVRAIDEHRRVTVDDDQVRPCDRQLWAALRTVGLDPARHDEATRAATEPDNRGLPN